METGKKPKNNLLLQYAGIAGQLAITLTIGVLAGMWADEKWNNDKPLLIWLAPLLILIGMLVKVVRDTSKK